MTENAFNPFKPPVLKMGNTPCILRQLSLIWGMNIWTSGEARLVPNETAMGISNGSRLKLTFQTISMDLVVTSVTKPIIGSAPVILQLTDPVESRLPRYEGFADIQDIPLSEVLVASAPDADIDSVIDQQKVSGVWLDGVCPREIISSICSQTKSAFWRNAKGKLRIGTPNRSQPLELHPIRLKSVNDQRYWAYINNHTWPELGQTVRFKNIEGIADRFDLHCSGNRLQVWVGFCKAPDPPQDYKAWAVRPVQTVVTDPSGPLLEITSGPGKGQIIRGCMIQTGLKAYKLDLPLEADDRLTALLPGWGVHIGPVAALPGHLADPAEQLTLNTTALRAEIEQLEAKFHKTSSCSGEEKMVFQANGIDLDSGTDFVRIIE